MNQKLKEIADKQKRILANSEAECSSAQSNTAGSTAWDSSGYNVDPGQPSCVWNSNQKSKEANEADEAAITILLAKLDKLDDNPSSQAEKLKLMRNSVAKLASTQAGSRYL